MASPGGGMVDAGGLNPPGTKVLYRFESDPGHGFKASHNSSRTSIGARWARTSAAFLMARHLTQYPTRLSLSDWLVVDCAVGHCGVSQDCVNQVCARKISANSKLLVHSVHTEKGVKRSTISDALDNELRAMASWLQLN